MSDKPTFVLLHGALTDGSVGRGGSHRLQHAGHQVTAPSLPMRTLDGDAAHLQAFLAGLSGPLVVVGHPFAGSVLSHPDALTPAVPALVFVAAFQQDAGETTADRAGSVVTEIDSSHAIPIAHPEAVTTVVLSAAEHRAPVRAG